LINKIQYRSFGDNDSSFLVFLNTFHTFDLAYLVLIPQGQQVYQ